MLQKGFYYLKTKGLLPTAKLVFIFLCDALRTLFFRCVAHLLYPLRCKAIQNAVKGKKVFVFTPTVEWNDLYQRVHQMATCFGMREDCISLFLSSQRHFDNFFGLMELKKGVWSINATLAGKIDQLTEQADCVIVSVYNITSCEALDKFHADKLVYEYVDELRFIVSKAVDFAPFEKKHLELLQKADLTVATATRLFEQVQPLAKKALLSPNAGDYALFSKLAPIAPALQNARNGYQCVLEYYGAIADWFDYDTVKSSALAHSDWLWILIGKVLGEDLKHSGLEELPNVIILPPVAYETLPGYIAAADILTIPFVINETTLATSPVKLFEYMAAGKPILTSDMPECRYYKSVTRYSDSSDLDHLVPQLMQQREDPDFIMLEKKEALENTWMARCEAELRELGFLEDNHDNIS